MPVSDAKVGQKHQSIDTSKSGVHDKISITSHESCRTDCIFAGFESVLPLYHCIYLEAPVNNSHAVLQGHLSQDDLRLGVCWANALGQGPRRGTLIFAQMFRKASGT